MCFYLCLCLSHDFKIGSLFDKCYIFCGECYVFCGRDYILTENLLQKFTTENVALGKV